MGQPTRYSGDTHLMRFEGHLYAGCDTLSRRFQPEPRRFGRDHRKLIRAGVHGIIVAGTTGEYYAQTADERVEMMGLAKELIAGRLPMIVGTGRDPDGGFQSNLQKRRWQRVLTLCWSQPRLTPPRQGERSLCMRLRLTGRRTCR